MKRLGPLRRKAAAVLVAGGLLTLPTAGAAHGGVSMDDDMCKLRLGPYYMHFTGYQVRAGSPNSEFCEDIPETGKTIIVMDAIDQALRHMPVAIRIMTSVDGAEDRTVVELPPKIYPSGSISLEYAFERPGQFVGLVVAGDQGEYTSRFPFSVGIPKRPYGFYGLIAMVVMMAVGLFRYSGPRRAKSALQ